MNFEKINGRHLVIGVPSYDGKILVDWIASYTQLVLDALDYGISVELEPVLCNALIANARNTIIKKFLDRKFATDLLFIDADIVWKSEDVFKLLEHVVEFDFVAALYCKKQDPAKFFIDLALKDNNMLDTTESGLMECNTVPTGFMMITKNVITKMIESYPDLKYTTSEENPIEMYGLFEDRVLDHRYYGEDIVFCKRWTNIGGRIWMDPRIHLDHIGLKRYNYSFAEYVGLKNV